jgi:hypothetical protein
MDAPMVAGDAQAGLAQVRALHAVVFAGGGLGGGDHAPEQLAWARAITGTAHGVPRGLDLDGLPADWCAALSSVGVPLAPAGASEREGRDLRWGRDILCPSGNQATLVVSEGLLMLPAIGTLVTMSSLALKPLRAFIASHLGIRLQAAAGIHVVLWANQAVLVSCAAVPLGGFFHGPQVGQRTSVALEPGGVQVLRW